ncbi:glycosyltransferase family 4 protein [Candidatus Thioglobus sp.]|nr:glycosyltransferase family 4 protein [Candidatus Thioglobus sp.]
MKKIILFYKSLIKHGGAERLLIEELNWFERYGHQVDVVVFEYRVEATFNIDISKNITIIQGYFQLQRIINLARYLKQNKNALVLCSSGHLDMYLASLLSKTAYSLHIHHPAFMTMNEYTKYSIFQRKVFKKNINNNFGAQNFLEVLNKLSLQQHIKINLRAILDILAIKKSSNIFVLSNYAKQEKYEMYGVDSHVIKGAISHTIIENKQSFSSFSDNEKYTIFSIARIENDKRIDVLIKALRIVLEQKNDVILMIGGTGSEVDNLKLLAKNIGVSDNIMWLGFVEENKLMKLYSSSDLFVSVDWADFIITSYEALSVGTKVLLSNETDHEKFLVDNNYMFLTEPTEFKVAKAIIKAIHTEPKISQLQLLDYLCDFTWKEYCKNILKAILK